MIRIILFFFLGIAVIAGVTLAFYFSVGAHLSLSDSPKDWAIFASYFGGVAGTLLSFLSITLILYTISQQNIQIESSQEEMLKRDILHYISRADDEIERWLQRDLASTSEGGYVKFGDIVWGIVTPTYASKKELVAAIERLHKLTCTYCVSLGLYKDNINTYFIFQHHRQKAEDLIAFIDTHKEKLDDMVMPSLDFCKSHLNSDDKV